MLEPQDMFPILPSPSEELCVRRECPNRIPPAKWLLLHRIKITVAQVLFLLVCAAFAGGNLALKVHAQGNTQDINSTDIAVNAAKLVDVTARVQALESHDVTQDQASSHQGSEISVMQGVGIAFPAFLILLQVIQIVMGRKQP